MAENQELDRGVAKDLLIAEFNGLRQEQFNRTAAQQVLINLNLTAAVAIGGIALSRLADKDLPSVESRQSLLLLLFLPLLSFALGLQYYGQDRSIILVGRYIDMELRPLACRLAGGVDVFGWEPNVRRHERGRTIRFVMISDMLLLFPGIGALALAFSSPVAFTPPSPQPLVGVIWVVEALLALILAALWIPAANRSPLEGPSGWLRRSSSGGPRQGRYMR